MKKMGRFRMIKRTEGVSSTDIVGRMLMCTRVNPRISEVPGWSQALRGFMATCGCVISSESYCRTGHFAYEHQLCRP